MLDYRGWWDDGSWDVHVWPSELSGMLQGRERGSGTRWAECGSWSDPAMLLWHIMMDLPSSQSTAWSLSVKIPVGSAMRLVLHLTLLAAEFLPAIIIWASQSLVQIPALRPGSPWHNVAFDVKLHSWRLFISDIRWFSPNCFSQENFFWDRHFSDDLFHLKVLLSILPFWFLLLLLPFFFQKNRRKNLEASLFQIHGFLL